MFPLKFLMLISSGLVSLLLIGCSVFEPTPTPIPPTETPVPPIDASFTRLTITTQFRDDRDVAETGYILAPGSSVSFGPSGELENNPPGFWRSIDDGKYTVPFFDPQGQVVGLVELQGTVEWNGESHITEGKESFLQIQVESGIWLDIVEREILEGHLVLTDENGERYTIVSFGPEFSGVMDKD